MRTKLKYLIVIPLALVVFSILPRTSFAAYLYNRSITVGSGEVSSTLSNFPTLVAGTYSYLANVANGGRVQNSNGFDIGFYGDVYCATQKLNWETESYNSSTGAVAYWVDVPSISTGTVIYLCYDNASTTTDQSDATGVWDSHYAGVWHLSGANFLDDSTVNANTAFNSNVASTTGSIVQAASFNGSNAALTVGGATGTLDITGPITISAWIKPAVLPVTTGQYYSIFGKGYDGSAQQYAFDLKNDVNSGDQPALSFSTYNGTVYGTSYLYGSNLSTSTWTYVTASFDGADYNIYVNGSLVASTSATTAPIHSNVGTEIGATNITGSLSRYFNGDIDEVHVSNSARSPAWIATEYNNQNAPSSFYAVGSEQPVVPRTLPPVLSGGAPSGTLAIGTTSSTLSLVTDEAATCKYSTSSGVAYASMTNTFTTTGGTTQSTTISGLSNEGSYTFYVRCQDDFGNTNNTDYLISFNVAGRTNTYSISTPFSSVTATGILAGTVQASNTFDGISQITIQLSNGVNTATSTVTPSAGTTSASWQLTVPSATGSYALSGSHAGGGSITTDPSAQTIPVDPILPLSTLQANYEAQKCGVFFHFNMSTFTQDEWATPNLDPNTFAPTGLNIDQWMSAVASSGCKYAILTTKHHDGFSLWPTSYHVPGYGPYSIASTTWYANNSSTDIVGLFVQEAHKYNITPILYFSIWDRTYEARASTTAIIDPTDYTAMIETELKELLTNYGDVGGIWTDGWGWNSAVGEHSYILYPTIRNFIKSIQPNALLIENDHAESTSTSDIVEYEVPAIGTVANGNTTPAEEADTSRFDGNWFYHSSLQQDPSVMYSPRVLANNISYANENGATYVIDVTPTTAGVLPSSQIALLDSLKDEQQYTTSDLALNASATSSSLYPGIGTAADLTDGVFKTASGDSNLFSTNTGDTTPYAEIDLGSAENLGRLEIFNRTDGPSAGRFRDLTIQLYNASNTLLYTSPTLNPSNDWVDGTYADGPGEIAVNLTSSTNARYIRVSRQSTGSSDDQADLAMMEVAAFAPLPAPSITSFTASPSSITEGSSFTLSWNVSGAVATTTVIGNNLNFTISSSSQSGSVLVTPNALGSFTYTLTVFNDNASSSATTAVTVNAPGSNNNTSTPTASVSVGVSAGGSPIPANVITNSATPPAAGSVVSTSTPGSSSQTTLLQLKIQLLGLLNTLLNNTETQSGISSATNPTAASTQPFLKNLAFPSSNPDVRRLQVYLNDRGFVLNQNPGTPGAPGYETDYFGEATLRELVKFQKSVGIPATGYFGPLTRAWINSH